MSEFPENEKQTEPASDQEEFSTIFSAPAEHRQKKTGNGGKRRILKAVAAVLAVAILAGGTVAIVKLIPERTEPETADPFQTISVLDLETDAMKSVTVTNANGTFTLYSEEEVKEDTSSTESSAATKTVHWYLEGYEKDRISTSAAGSVASAAAKIEATREIMAKTASECGLDTPTVRADIVNGDGTQLSVFIGADSPDGTGVYLKLSTKETLYLVESTVAESLTFDALSLADTTAIAGITLGDDLSAYKDSEGALSTFDSITVSGNNFPEPMVIQPNTDESLSQYAAYMVASPTKRIAEKVDELLNLFKSGVSVSGAYAMDASASSVAAVGLDRPDLTATIRLGSFSYTYRFKKQADGNYAVLCDDSIMIKKVTASLLSFIDYKVTDFYATWVCLQSINELSNFTIQTPEKTYSFGIRYDDSEDAKETYEITYNGNKLTAQSFQEFYQYCISLSCVDFTVEPLSTEPALSMTFTYSDTARAPSTVTFRKATETTYQYSIDGTEMGRITSAQFNKIERYAEKVANGGTING